MFFPTAKEWSFLLPHLRSPGDDRTGDAREREYVRPEGRKQHGVCDRSSGLGRHAELVGHDKILHAYYAHHPDSE